jgi:hypothetical protein
MTPCKPAGKLVELVEEISNGVTRHLDDLVNVVAVTCSISGCDLDNRNHLSKARTLLERYASKNVRRDS